MHIDLEGTFLFSNLTKEQQALIVGGSEYLNFDQGDLFIKDEEIADSLYIIVDGAAQVIKSGARGVTKLKNISAGVVIGEMSYGISGANRTATCMAAAGGVRVLCVPYSTITGLKQTSPDLYMIILERLLKIAHGYLRDSNEYLHSLKPAVQFAKKYGPMADI
jgi:CRP-like cAMP-binding protein